MAEIGTATADILPQKKKKVELCGSCVKFPQNSVKEATKTQISYLPVASSPPKGYFPISATLSCSPAFEGLKDARVKLSVICSTSERVDCAIFRKEHTGSWTLLDDSHPLTDEKHLELHYRNIDNITAFLPIDRLKDVEFLIVCFQLISTDGRYAVGFCADDEAIRKAFLQRMEKECFSPILENMDSLVAKVSDEFNLKVASENRHRFSLKDLLSSETQSHICYDDLDEIVEESEYRIVQQRMEVDNLATVFEKDYTVKLKESKQEAHSPSLQIKGGLKARNFFHNAQRLNINMSEHTYEDEDDSVPFSEDDDSHEEKHTVGLTSDVRKPKKRGDETQHNERRGNVLIEGDVVADNAFLNVSDASINMSKHRKKTRTRNTKKQRDVARTAVENVDEGGDAENAASPIWKNANTEDGTRRRTQADTVSPRERFEGDQHQDAGGAFGNVMEERGGRLDHIHISLLTLLALCALWIFYKFII